MLDVILKRFEQPDVSLHFVGAEKYAQKKSGDH